MPKIKNKDTGKIFTASQSDWDNGVYSSQHWELAEPTSTSTSASTPATPTSSNIVTLYFKGDKSSPMQVPSGDVSYWKNQGWEANVKETTTPTTTPKQTTTTPTSNLTLDNLLKDDRVKNDKGVNNTTMADWLKGNASLLPKLESLEYTTTDLINEAYAQTRYNRSAFTKDMTTTTRGSNQGYDFSGQTPGTDLSDTTEDITDITEDVTDMEEDESDLPDEITQSEYWQNLTDEMKKMIETLLNVYTIDDEETKKIAEDALNEAIKQVDPYSQIMLKFAIDSIPDEFKVTKLSIEDKRKSAQENLVEIQKLMKDAGLEEQQALNNLARGYEQNLVGYQDQLADAGLTYSSKRSDLERYIANQNLDLTESTKRSAATRIRTLEKSETETKRGEELIKTAGEAQLKAMARQAEEQVGTDEFTKLGLKGLTGDTIKPIGGEGGTEKFAGSIEQQRQSMILNLAQQLKEYESPTALTNLFNQ